MKIIIKENKMQVLINNLLDEEFGDLYDDRTYITDFTGEWLTINYKKEGKIVMIYRDDLEVLYVATEMLSKLNIFGFSSIERQMSVEKWFESRYELPVDRVSSISIRSMN
jgi:hypothetical protein